jgi:hypothetical protein
VKRIIDYLKFGPKQHASRFNSLYSMICKTTFLHDSVVHVTGALNVSGGEIASSGAPIPNAARMLSVLPNGPNFSLTVSGINVCSLTRLSPPDPRCGDPTN